MAIPVTVKKLLAGMAAALVIAVTGTALTWLQVIRQQQQEFRQAANVSAVQIDTVLDEAARTAREASSLLGRPCGSAHQQLTRMAATRSHIRLISLFQEGKLVCSSWEEMPSAMLLNLSSPRQHLRLLPDNPLSPGTPVLLLLTPYPEGEVSVSIHISDILNIMRLTSPQHELIFQTDGVALSADGEMMTQQDVTSGYQQISSGQFPFAISYPVSQTISLQALMTDGRLLLIFFALLSVLTGWSVWRYALSSPSLYHSLRDAIRRGEIIPYYQPVFFSPDVSLAGVEILARWRHPELGLISADQFIPLAEQSDLSIPLTRSLMQQVIRDLQPLGNVLPPDFYIAFNITSDIPDKAHFLSDCRQFMQAFELNSGLILEITERRPLHPTPELEDLFTHLRKEGVKIALDDFGTGHANLQVLTQLAFDYIKIDRAFIARIEDAETPAPLVDAVIDLARKLGMSIVAEGVESTEHVAWLRHKQVDYLQGYYFSPPLPADAFIPRYLHSAPPGAGR